MLKRILLSLAFLVGFVAFELPQGASAEEHHKGSATANGGNRSVGGSVNRSSVRVVVPRNQGSVRLVAPRNQAIINSQRIVRSSGGKVAHYSHRRHHWHGRWWAYGVGSCWAYDANWDEYYWTCGDDDDD